MISREAYEQVGGMEESYFLYYEELDYCETIRRAGFEIMVEPNAMVYHKESYSTSKISNLKLYYLTRNRLLWVRRNRSFLPRLSFGLLFYTFTLPIHTLRYLVKREFSNIGASWRAAWWHILDLLGYDNDHLDPVPRPDTDQNKVSEHYGSLGNPVPVH